MDFYAVLDQVLDLLRARRGHDFSNYKRSTQRRRIHRRMGLRNIVVRAKELARGASGDA